MNAKTDDKKHTADLGTLHVIRDAARAARQRIVDGRAREAMALFEHELTYRLESLAKGTVPPPPPPSVKP